MANKLLTALLALVCILLGYILYSTLEVYKESVDSGWTFAAKRNPYLATELLLRRLGSQVESSDSKSAVARLDEFDSLLITHSGLVVNQAMADQLLDWVARGGELVIGANETRGLLLERLGVEYKAVTYHYDDGEQRLYGDRGWSLESEFSPVGEALGEFADENNKRACRKCEEDKTQDGCEQWVTDEAADKLQPKKKFSDILKETNKKNQEKSLAKENAEAESGAVAKGNAASREINLLSEKISSRRITHLSFTGQEQEVDAAFSPWSIIHHPAIEKDAANGQSEKNHEAVSEYAPFYWIGSRQGIHFMQFYVGDGMITVVSDASIWNSHLLARQDHGFLLQSLGFQKKSLILYGVAMPSIMSLAWTKFPEFILTASLLIGLWLWQKAIRVGPLRQHIDTARRSVMNSIMGLASYQHKRKKYSRLLQPVIADILLLANRHIPGFAAAESTKRDALLSEHAGISQNAVALAMNPEAVQDDDAFQETILLLRKIRKTL
ncbi:MAG TPA: DUF4350 domain-containing protein [Cellvibrio sp.]|nr:DUF4350 domain-containing protein [Cellvibrio sp.]